MDDEHPTCDLEDCAICIEREKAAARYVRESTQRLMPLLKKLAKKRSKRAQA